MVITRRHVEHLLQITIFVMGAMDFWECIERL